MRNSLRCSHNSREGRSTCQCCSRPLPGCGAARWLRLRWKDMNLKKATLQVAQVVELVGGKVSVKEPKPERSRRTIALPARLVGGD